MSRQSSPPDSRLGGCRLRSADGAGVDRADEGLVQADTGVEARLFEQFEAYIPELAKLVVLREVTTPLATVAITGHSEGVIYGLDVTPRRMLSDALRMKTPIDGLCLAGQDVASPGIPGALWGGLLCAASIDPRAFLHLRG